ncbi:MAG TPA: glycosyltransferase family 2 protein [Acidobacteriota bacterium]|nr:glycosyltransferase family 2 protein [Acidobacteriota bacterium]
MTAPPEISAVVISYNGMKFLPDCLRTLQEDLRGFRHEVIVVDNGSRDGSVEFVRRTFPRMTLIDNGRNLGFARAVNIGLQAAAGDFLYVLNQDLRFPDGTAARLLARLKADDTIGLIGPAYHDFDGHLQSSARSLPSYRHMIYKTLLLDRLFPRHREFSSWKMGWFDHRSEMFVDQPMGSVMLIRREVVARVGLMDERFPLFMNDVDYCRRMRDAGYRLLYYPEAVVEHYVGASTGARPYRMIVSSHRSLYRYLAKYARAREYPLLWLSGLLLLLGLVPRLLGRLLLRAISSAKLPPGSRWRGL